MKSKRIKRTIIASISALSIAMAGVTPIRAEEVTSNLVRPTDKNVTVKVYGDVSVSQGEKDGKIFMQLAPAGAEKVSNLSQYNSNEQTAAFWKDSWKSLVTDNTELSVGDLSTDTNSTQGIQTLGLEQATQLKNLSIDADGSNDDSVTTSVSDTAVASNAENNLRVTVGTPKIKADLKGTTTVVLSGSQKVNLCIQDNCAATMEMNATQIQINEATKSTPNLADTSVQLSKEQVMFLCRQLFVVDDDKKCIVINLRWWQTNRDKPSILNRELTKLQEYTKVGYYWYGVDLPINSLLNTTEAFTLADKTRQSIETAISDNSSANPSGRQFDNNQSIGKESNTDGSKQPGTPSNSTPSKDSTPSDAAYTDNNHLIGQ